VVTTTAQPPAVATDLEKLRTRRHPHRRVFLFSPGNYRASLPGGGGLSARNVFQSARRGFRAGPGAEKTRIAASFMGSPVRQSLREHIPAESCAQPGLAPRAT